MSKTSTGPNDQPIVKSAWHDQALWSEVGNQLKSQLTKWRLRATVAGVLGATLETLAAFLPDMGPKLSWIPSVLALSGAAVLAVVPYVIKTKVSKERVNEWVRARSASEAIKETIFRYLVGVVPFSSDRSPKALLKSVQAIKDKVQDLALYAAISKPKLKERPLELDVYGYIEKRVDDQIGYYKPNAKKNAEAADKLHNAEFWLGLAAVIMGACGSKAGDGSFSWLANLGPWVAVVTTASAALTAHIAASRFDHLAMTYFATAERLKGYRNEWYADENKLDPNRIAEFVDDCEHAISTENEAWLVGWTREKASAEDGAETEAA
jgi:hypothetical protein